VELGDYFFPGMKNWARDASQGDLGSNVDKKNYCTFKSCIKDAYLKEINYLD